MGTHVQSLEKNSGICTLLEFLTNMYNTCGVKFHLVGIINNTSNFLYKTHPKDAKRRIFNRITQYYVTCWFSVAKDNHLERLTQVVYFTPGCQKELQDTLTLWVLRQFHCCCWCSYMDIFYILPVFVIHDTIQCQSRQVGVCKVVVQKQNMSNLICCLALKDRLIDWMSLALLNYISVMQWGYFKRIPAPICADGIKHPMFYKSMSG